MKTINTKLIVTLIAAALMTACGGSDNNNNNNGTYLGLNFTNTLQAQSTSGGTLDIDLYTPNVAVNTNINNNFNNNVFNSVPATTSAAVRGTVYVPSNATAGLQPGWYCSVNGRDISNFIPEGTYTITTETQGQYTTAANVATDILVRLAPSSRNINGASNFTALLRTASFGNTSNNPLLAILAFDNNNCGLTF